MENVTITGLTRVRDAKQNKGGSTVLAYFDCETRGLAIMGCAFVRTPKNGLTVWPPKIETPQTVRRAINFIDCSLRAEMLRKARETYLALGGKDGEWRPHSGDASEYLHPYRGSDEKGWPTHPLHPNYSPPDSDDGEDLDGLKTFLKISDDTKPQGVG